MEKKPVLTPEILINRLGDYLVERGLISQQDLQRALEYQQALRGSGRTTPLLGQILMDMNLIDRATLDEAITEQIIALRSALQEINQQLERRVAERTADLEQALRKLSELNQLKSNFVSNVSHELRTPLTHIKGYLELLLTGELGSLTGEQKQALSVMQRSSDRLERLIEDLILFSITERGEIFLNISAINLVNLCLNLVNRFKKRATENGIDLRLQSPIDLPEVRGDEQKISWVIMQLLDNALKFTSSGGKVTLILEQESKMVRVSVTDSGIGISAEKILEIFEPFHQLDGSATRKYAGTGLGLALARKIVEAHGSVIHVTSEVGKGSEFQFLLSLAEI